MKYFQYIKERIEILARYKERIELMKSQNIFQGKNRIIKIFSSLWKE